MYFFPLFLTNSSYIALTCESVIPDAFEFELEFEPEPALKFFISYNTVVSFLPLTLFSKDVADESHRFLKSIFNAPKNVSDSSSPSIFSLPPPVPKLYVLFNPTGIPPLRQEPPFCIHSTGFNEFKKSCDGILL